ncbi:MAG: DVU0298 family protein [Thermodesulfobacteriota bacterium]
MTERQIKRLLPGLLRDNDFAHILAELRQYPRKFTVSALISGIYQTDEVIKWRSIQAMGPLMNDLAGEEMEDARLVMRRLLWSLNEESAGIGWGMPEAMGEIMAISAELADEYGHMLVSYMREENYLELPALQKGLLWGVGRLAMVRPEIIRRFDGEGYMSIYLESADRQVRVLAARNFGILGTPEAEFWIRGMFADKTPVRLFEDGEFLDTSVGELARQAVQRITAGGLSAQTH